jgi:homoserine kinase
VSVRAVRVRVPATSANLGPGFDAFGLALGLNDEVEVRADAGGSGVRVEVEGEGAGDLARDEGNLVARAVLAAYDAMGERPPGLELRCTNRIPHGRGLGSSAAAIVAGVVAARELAAEGNRLDGEAALALASAMEGHPDNVAACLLGGFTVAWLEGEARTPRAVRLVPSAEVCAVALIPAAPVSTELARGLLPAQVPHAEAARNAGRAALLVAALTQRPDLLLAATEDWLHQPYRAQAMPESAGAVRRLRAEGIAAVVSGAGPTVLALGAGLDPARVGDLAGPHFATRCLDLVASGVQASPA